MENLVDRPDTAIPAPSTPGDTGPAQPVGSAPTISTIAEGRGLIDGIDAQLRALLANRRGLSSQIQALRQVEGGPRIEHARENEIIASWADELGPRGVEIALAVLTLCRGATGQQP
ncbi:Chorismate mutase domain-containing protein [Frankia sp. AiPs1]|uniref:chorismate mutase n=1 Tax=Frankia sp. AiPa1 TaxID=573492 RepID=UPI00202AF845|nr:chorismate mutase [Frankia sp. AiPa1]MCL9758366.1 chorismate mutase [Frankia sp. AiPa1]